MEHHPSLFDRTLPPVRLTLGDLQSLCDRLSREGKLHIDVGDFRYDTLAEMALHATNQFTDRIDIVVVAKSNVYTSLTVSVYPEEVNVYADDALKELATIVLERLRPFSPWYSWRSSRRSWTAVTSIVGVVLGMMVVAIVAEALTREGVQRAIANALGWAAGIPVLWLGIRWQPILGRSRVELQPSPPSPGFWDRNKDAIWVGIITTAVGGLLGFLLGKAL